MNGVENNDVVNKEGTNAAEASVAADLTAAAEAIKQQSQLVELMRVPGVREALIAAEQGRKIQIVDCDAAQETKDEKPAELTAEQIDEMPNSSLVNYLRSQLISELKNELKNAIAPLSERLKTSESHIENDLKAKVNADLKALCENYNDVDKFKESMFKIYQETGIKDVNELYVLAKTRAKSPIVSNKELAAATESELPFAVPGGRTPRTEIKATGLGRAGWNSIMEQSLKSVGLS